MDWMKLLETLIPLLAAGILWPWLRRIGRAATAQEILTRAMDILSLLLQSGVEKQAAMERAAIQLQAEMKLKPKVARQAVAGAAEKLDKAAVARPT